MRRARARRRRPSAQAREAARAGDGRTAALDRLDGQRAGWRSGWPTSTRWSKPHRNRSPARRRRWQRLPDPRALHRTGRDGARRGGGSRRSGRRRPCPIGDPRARNRGRPRAPRRRGPRKRRMAKPRAGRRTAARRNRGPGDGDRGRARGARRGARAPAADDRADRARRGGERGERGRDCRRRARCARGGRDRRARADRRPQRLSPQAREARAGAAARAEAQDARRAEFARQMRREVRMPAAAAARTDRLRSRRARRPRGGARRRSTGWSPSASGSARSTWSPSRNSPNSTRRANSSAAERDELHAGDQPPARIDRQPQPRGARAAAGGVRAGRSPFPQPVHHPVRGRRGASRAGRERRSAGGGAGDHGAAAGQAPVGADPVVGRRAGADRGGADLRPVPDQPGADLRARRGRRAARRRQCRALLRPARSG